MQVTEHKIRTLAHQLAETLAVYASSFDHWREDPSDLGRYERTHANLELVRVLAEKAFPGACPELADLLRCHTELKLAILRGHLARRSGRPPAADSGLGMLQARHDAVVSALSTLGTQRSRDGGPSAARGLHS